MKVFWKWFLTINHTGTLLSRLVRLNWKWKGLYLIFRRLWLICTKLFKKSWQGSRSRVSIRVTSTTEPAEIELQLCKKQGEKKKGFQLLWLFIHLQMRLSTHTISWQTAHAYKHVRCISFLIKVIVLAWVNSLKSLKYHWKPPSRCLAISALFNHWS